PAAAREEPRGDRTGEPRQAAPEAARRAEPGRDRREGGLDSPLERAAHLRALQQAGARRATAPRRRARRAGLPALRRADGQRVSSMAARLRERYTQEIVPALMRESGYRNVLAVPRREKIVLNMGLGEATQNPPLPDGAVRDLPGS